MAGKKRRRKRKKKNLLLRTMMAVLLLFLGTGALKYYIPGQWVEAAGQYLPAQVMKILSELCPQYWLEGTGAGRILSDLPWIGAWFQTEEATAISGELRVEFLDVGQGDCTLVTLDGHAMLIDCGPEKSGTQIQYELRKKGITRLDYVIGTHPDADHIGGMDVILSKFDCDCVIMPEEQRETRAYQNVQNAIWYRGYQVTAPRPGDVFELGDARFTILGPVWHYDEMNNHSVALRLLYGTTSFLFTGDAQEEEEYDLMGTGLNLKSDVYQAGHHGSSSSSCDEFLDAVMPAFTVISCGEGNDYGHPHRSTLQRLDRIGSEVLRTDLLGTVTAISDGSRIVWLR